MKLQSPNLYQDINRVQLPAARLVRTHRSASILAIVLVSLGFTSCSALFTPWQQSSSGMGQVVAYNPLERRQVLGAPVKGRIARWHVTEGSFVKKGQLIANLEDLDPKALQRIRQQRSAILEQLKVAKRQAKAYTAKVKSLNEVKKLHLRANSLKIQMAQQKYKGSIQKQKAIAASLRTALINYKRLKRLKKDEIVSNRTFEVAELKVAKLRNELNAAKASMFAARAMIVESRAQRMKKSAEDDSKINSAEADFQKALDKAASTKNKLAKSDLNVARQASQVIRAPRDAVILSLLVNEHSEMLKAGDPIAIMVPEANKLAVELWVDGNDTPLVKKGRKVRLQFEGWPAIQFTGWPSVAVGTFGGVVALVDVTTSKQGKFRVVVTPDESDAPWPKAPFLRQGMKAKGWILLQQVSLGYEIWRQLNGFPPTVDAPKEPVKKKAPLKKAKK